jgi:hypothetical protein
MGKKQAPPYTHAQIDAVELTPEQLAEVWEEVETFGRDFNDAVYDAKYCALCDRDDAKPKMVRKVFE